jgi:hypothetical protein
MNWAGRTNACAVERAIAATLVAGILCVSLPADAAEPPTVSPAVPGDSVGAAAPAAQDDPLMVQVVTFGPGSHPFTKFGHNAIRVVDGRARTDVVYNFGTFSFDSPRLIVDFLQGRLRYWLSRSRTVSTVNAYHRENRDIAVQELNLSPDEKRQLALRLEDNALPANREYRYDYFRDNCSTRVRDALDGVMGGRLRPGARAAGTMTLRAHALRMAADNLPLYLALLIVLGPSTDRPIDQWAEAFLPEMLQRTLRGATAYASGGPPRPLVKAERVVFTSSRPAVRREAPTRWPVFLAAGFLGGLALFICGRLGSRFALARILFGILMTVLGVVAGTIGCFLVGAWALTPHEVVYGNQNILLFSPFAIALAVLGIGVAIGRPGAKRKVFLVAAWALGLATIACAFKLLPWWRQENGALIALMLPFWFGVTAGARAIATGRHPSLAS